MRQRRTYSRRPLHHAVRLVNLRFDRVRHIAHEEQMRAIEVGLCAAQVLTEQFPAFAEQTQLAEIPVNNGAMLGCCAALWQLTEQTKGIELRWPGDGYSQFADGITRYQCEADPAATLRMFNDAADSFLAELGHFIFCVRPAYFGYGVEELLDLESDNYPSDPLTLTLWHLFNETALGLGIDVSTMTANIDEDLVFDILRIKRLPKSTPIALLCSVLKLPIADQYGVSVQDLIGYPSAKTQNELANNSDYEVEAIYMGELDDTWDWAQLDQLARLSHDAEQLSEAYSDWCSQIKTIQDVRRLAGALHKAARQAERELTAPAPTLVTLLGGEPPSIADRRLAWAEERLLQEDEEVAV